MLFLFLNTKGVFCIAYVSIPKDLNQVKTKLAFNLTKRQIICFAMAGGVAVPVYLFLKNSMGLAPDLSAICMVITAIPFFFLALYQKNGQTPEQIGKSILKVKFFTKAERPYKTKNVYRFIHEATTVKEREGTPIA